MVRLEEAAADWVGWEDGAAMEVTATVVSREVVTALMVAAEVVEAPG